MSTEDTRFMKLAINMARSGIGKTFPRPSVGAVIAKNGKLISCAVTSNGGAPHAEPKAIEQAGNEAKGATLYVTLEPCNHHGRTPPCTDAVMASGIKKIFIANKDENPAATGGIQKLEAAGIEVSLGLCANEAMEINQPFFYTIHKKRPYITVKIGSSLDGKIALENGDSKYITSDHSRRYVQALRNKMDGILVGANTIINDDPELNCRLPGLEKKLPKIILDTNNKISDASKIIKNSSFDPVIVFTSKERLLGKAEVIKSPITNKMIDLNFAMQILAEKGFERLLVEGGAKIISSYIANKLVDELQIVYSAKIMGSKTIGFSSGLNIETIAENQFDLMEQRKLGDDILLIFKKKF